MTDYRPKPSCPMCHLAMAPHCTTGKCGWWECAADGVIHDGKARFRSKWKELR